MPLFLWKKNSKMSNMAWVTVCPHLRAKVEFLLNVLCSENKSLQQRIYSLLLSLGGIFSIIFSIVFSLDLRSFDIRKYIEPDVFAFFAR
jgi:hypothetical protein